MKYSMQAHMAGKILRFLVKKDFPRKDDRKRILSECGAILEHALFIGSRLLSSDLLAEIMGLHLDRTMVPAEGAPIWDFRFRR